jgi:hypothetical protein
METLFKVATNLLSQDDQFPICSIKLLSMQIFGKMWSLVTTTPVANLPLVTMTTVVN